MGSKKTARKNTRRTPSTAQPTTQESAQAGSQGAPLGGLSMGTQWEPSLTTQESLERLVAAGVLPEQAVAEWRVPTGDAYPMPRTDEAVVFEGYFTRGFGIPPSSFLRDLLVFLGISLCNLPPNSVLHIAVFCYLCECWLGIEPHFNLFRYLFCLRKRTGKGSRVVGGCYLKLRDGRATDYIGMPLTSNPGPWMRRWFYIRQDAAAWIPSDPGHVPEPLDSWSSQPLSRGDLDQVNELIELLRQTCVQGPEVVRLFITRRCQPLMARVLRGFEYDDLGSRGQDDTGGPVPDEDVESRLSELFDLRGYQAGVQAFPFSLSNPPPPVSSSSD
jgi:hypothetical protein